MGRKKIFPSGDMPRGAASVAVALIADYDRRQAEIMSGGLSESVLSAYQKYQSIVDAGLLAVEAGYRREFISDIKAGRGWDSSYLSRVYSKAAYYARKRAVVYSVARGLHLVE